MKKLKLTAILLCCFMLVPAFAGCKVNNQHNDPTRLNIAVIAKGYGSDYAYALADAYNAAQSDIIAEVVKVTSEDSFVSTTLSSGAANNPIDVYFTLQNTMFSELARANTVPSYSGPAWADLSAVFTASAEGYSESGAGVTYGSLMDPFFLKSVTHPYYDERYEGKQYMVPWSTGFNGFLYNKALFDKANANLKAAGGTELKLPKTTKQMFALFERIKTEAVIYNTSIPGSGSEKKYAFAYSGIDNYMGVAVECWWPQYDGLEKAEKFLEGKDYIGGQWQYSATIYDTPGRAVAYDAAREMILKSNGYTNQNDISTPFKTSQLNFLKGKAFFNLNGDWLENEASNEFNQGEVDVRYFRAPVISDIVNNPKISALFSGLSADDKEERLIEVLNYIDDAVIDGKTVTKPAWLTGQDDALKFLTEARLVNMCQTQYVAAVPDYSIKKAQAVEFLKFMLSKTGQEAVMSASLGIKAPLSVDAAQFDYYSAATEMYKSKMDIMRKWRPFALDINYHPIFFLGGAQNYVGNNTSMATAFGTDSPLPAGKYFEKEVEYFAGLWSKIMADAFD